MLVQQEYLEASALTGDLKDNSRVSYRSVLTSRDRSILNVWLVMAVIAGLGLVSIMIAGTNPSVAGMVPIGSMISIEAIRVAQTLMLWTFARSSVDPVPMTPGTKNRVAVHTTIVPNKEPFYGVVDRTLLAMKKISYAGQVDIWLLDEGNNPGINTEDYDSWQFKIRKITRE